MKRCLYSILFVLLATSCGASKESELVSEEKAPAISKEFLVDLALSPAPEGKCPNGGVIQSYYYDLNGNGQLDSGENSGLSSAVDCYSGYIEKSNPCENKNAKCAVPITSTPPLLKDCKDATQDQKVMAAKILEYNEKGGVQIDAACATLVDLTKREKDTVVNLNSGISNGADASFSDYSLLPVLSSIGSLVIEGSGSSQKQIRNISAVKNLSSQVQALMISNLDFKDLPFKDFLPNVGVKNVMISECNMPRFEELARWSYITSSPITQIIDSTAVTTAGPKY
jgi:hypothetical protein